MQKFLRTNLGRMTLQLLFFYRGSKHWSSIRGLLTGKFPKTSNMDAQICQMLSEREIVQASRAPISWYHNSALLCSKDIGKWLESDNSCSPDRVRSLKQVDGALEQFLLEPEQGFAFVGSLTAGPAVVQ